MLKKTTEKIKKILRLQLTQPKKQLSPVLVVLS